MNVDQVTSIDELFDCWKKDPKNQGKGFYPDGVTSARGNTQKDKDEVDVLFVLKESHIDPDKPNDGTFWFDSSPDAPVRKCFMAKFQKMLDRLKEQDSTLDIDKFGYMNLNKQGGGSTTDNRKLKDYTDKYAVYIKKQIQIHSPKIIICFGRGCYPIVSDFCESVSAKAPKAFQIVGSPKFKSSTVSLFGKKIILMEMRHPSAFGRYAYQP